METKIIECKTKDDIEKLRKCSALTYEGLDLKYIDDYTNWVNNTAKFKDGNPVYYTVSGKLMNESYGLTGDNAYQDDLTIVSIKPEDVCNFMAFTLPRFSIGARWMDDIIDNNLMREDRKSSREDY